MRVIPLLLALALPASAFAQQRPEVVGTFATAKKRALDTIYAGKQTTFYCNCKFTGRKTIEPSSCGYEPRRDPRSPDASHDPTRDLEWEHVVPASRFGRTRACWQEPTSFPACRKSNGRFLSSRKCCRKVDQEFKEMEADLMNLRPAVGELNQDRSDNPYGDVDGEPRAYGACDFEVQGGVAEPDEPDRGEIGRTYLYMERVWGMVLTDDERERFVAWHEQDRPDRWERRRNQRIRELQGVGNPFIEGAATTACIARSLCCRVCVTSQPCGDSCISRSKTCTKAPTCACNAEEVCP